MKKTSMIIVSLVLAVYLSACGQDVPTSGNIFDMSQESSESQDTSTSDNSSETSEESSDSQDTPTSDDGSDTSEESSDSQDTPASDDNADTRQESSDSQVENVTSNETESSEAGSSSAADDEFVTSFTTDKNVYNSLPTGEVIGTLPAGQEVTIYITWTDTDGSVIYVTNWNGQMGQIYAGDEAAETAYRDAANELKANSNNKKPTASTSTTTATDTYYDIDMAKEIFAMVNAERAEAGVAELIWNDEAYSIAMQRCIENDEHNSARANTGENCFDTREKSIPASATAEDIHNRWHDSKGHYDNYMDSMYNRAAVAIYFDGTGYRAYEVFLPTWYETTE